MNLEDLEIEVKVVATHNNKSHNINVTHILSDRAFGEITDLIEAKLSKQTYVISRDIKIRNKFL